MAKNNSEFYVHAVKDGELQSFGPGEDIPSWVKVDNPYVTGKKDSEDEPQVDEVTVVDDDAPKRRTTRKG